METITVMRPLITIAQPCIFCEQTVYESTLWRDDETGREEWSNTPATRHVCDQMYALMSERVQGYRKGS